MIHCYKWWITCDLIYTLWMFTACLLQIPSANGKRNLESQFNENQFALSHLPWRAGCIALINYNEQPSWVINGIVHGVLKHIELSIKNQDKQCISSRLEFVSLWAHRCDDGRSARWSWRKFPSTECRPGGSRLCRHGSLGCHGRLLHTRRTFTGRSRHRTSSGSGRITIGLGCSYRAPVIKVTGIPAVPARWRLRAEDREWRCYCLHIGSARH